MADEVFIVLGEGERHPHEGHELRLIAAALVRIEQQLHRQNCLLHQILDLDEPQTYHPTLGGRISVE